MNIEKMSDVSHSDLSNSRAASAYLQALERHEYERQQWLAGDAGMERPARFSKQKPLSSSVYSELPTSDDLLYMRKVCLVMLYLVLAACVFCVLAWIIST